MILYLTTLDISVCMTEDTNLFSLAGNIISASIKTSTAAQVARTVNHLGQ